MALFKQNDGTESDWILVPNQYDKRKGLQQNAYVSVYPKFRGNY